MDRKGRENSVRLINPEKNTEIGGEGDCSECLITGCMVGQDAGRDERCAWLARGRLERDHERPYIQC